MVISDKIDETRNLLELKDGTRRGSAKEKIV
jgi:hypothetical protein